MNVIVHTLVESEREDGERVSEFSLLANEERKPERERAVHCYV